MRSFPIAVAAFVVAFWIAVVVAFLILPAKAGELPDPKLTPGVARTDLPDSAACTTKWGKDERAVTEAMKRQVFLEYGYRKGDKDRRCPCEVDHLVSRELLGADDVRNLWIQPYRGPWNAHMKDRLENRLHKEVCVTRSLTLERAQAMIRTNWIAAYRGYFGDP